MSLESNSNLGGVGALLIVLTSVFSFFSLIGTFLPSAALVFSPIALLLAPLGLAGIILFLVSMHGLAHVYRHSAIFNNALYAFLSVIVGSIVVFAVAFVLIIFELSRIIPIYNPGPVTSNLYPEVFQSLLGYLIPAFVAGAAVGLISMLFLMRSFNALAAKSSVARFRTAGLLFPVSAVIASVFLILAAGLAAAGSIPFTAFWAISLPGSAVQLAAWILATQAFFHLKADAKANQSLTSPPPASVSPVAGQVKYCSYCGAQNKPDALYCTRCGKQL